MALPKGVKSPVDYTKLYMSNELEGEVVSEKKMTKKQIKKRDEIADAIGKKDMKKRYGDENVRYAIATKLAMKEGVTDEALLIQDWNVDEIKYTEVEAVDIIKPEPLKPSVLSLRLTFCQSSSKSSLQLDGFNGSGLMISTASTSVYLISSTFQS